MNQLTASRKYPIGGIGIYQLGAEDPAIWDVLQASGSGRMSSQDLERLAPLDADALAGNVGKGEFVTVEDAQEDGQRRLAADDSGRIGEVYEKFPAYLTLSRQGAGQEDAVAISFDDLDSLPYPAYDLQHSIAYVPLLTSLGCPFSCDYCASSFLYPKRRRRSPESVMEEILFWHTRFHVVDFVFYDDALLIDAERHAIPLFEMIIRSGLNQTIRFHTPNAVHIREITMETAGLMYQAGFKTLRLGLETTAFDPDKRLDVKVSRNEFHQAVTCLKNAGFQSGDVGAYLLAGCPGQPVSDVEEAIHIVKETGITPVPAYYSPIPHTALWPQAVRFSRYPLEDDPIYTNNAILPCSLEPFSWETIRRLKEKCESDSFRHAVFIGPD